MRFKSLKLKIILATGISIAVVGVISYSVLYSYLTRVSLSRAAQTEQTRLAYIQSSIASGLDHLLDLGNEIANNREISRAILLEDATTTSAKRTLISAQETLGNSLTASASKEYIDKLLVFNSDGLMVQASARRQNYWGDAESVQALPLFARLQQADSFNVLGVSKTIVPSREQPCVAMISRVERFGSSTGEAWLYIELGLDFFADIIDPYATEPNGGIFLADAGSDGPLVAGGSLPEGLFAGAPAALENGAELTFGQSVYRLYRLPIGKAGLDLYSCADITLFTNDRQQVFVTLAVVLITCVAAVAILAAMLRLFVNKPLARLTGRLKRVAGNDFGFDAEIEKGNDEFAQVGRVVNEMTMSIDNLMRTTEEMYAQRLESEIALLQSQVNPHFLYNTLDSIHWMALIQNNPGIAKTVRSLSNLLRNLAKGVGDKITLAEELALLGDYVDTQKVRFMEMFELEIAVPEALLGCRIIKFTLQPLVENAIFHGIEPLGRCGTIRLAAREEDGRLYVVVEDDGVGMTPEELEKLMKATQNPHPKGMAGIGVANVDSRLKLVYGRQYGLRYESEKGAYTRVTLCIPKEDDDV